MHDRNPATFSRKVLLPLVLLTTGVGILLVGFLLRHEFAAALMIVRAGADEAIAVIRIWPLPWFFLALVVAPLLGLPVAPLLIALGLRLPLVAALPLAVLSIALNLLLSFQLSRTLLRRTLHHILQRMGHNLPAIAPENHLGMTLMFRITPGMPVFAGNYLLPMAGVPFSTYFAVSLVIQSLFSVGFIVLGRSLYSGAIGPLITAISLIITLSLISRVVHRYWKSRF